MDAQVRTFIASTFRSVWALELLLHLRNPPDRAIPRSELVELLRASDAVVSKSAEALIAAGLVRRVRDGIRLLGEGEITSGIRIEVNGASEKARAAVERAGGSVTIVGAGEAAS